MKWLLLAHVHFPQGQIETATAVFSAPNPARDPDGFDAAKENALLKIIDGRRIAYILPMSITSL